MGERGIGTKEAKLLPHKFFAVLTALLCAALYAPVIVSLARQWINDPNYQHGTAVPLVAIFMFWKRRSKLLAMPATPSIASGIVVIAAASLFLVMGTASSELFTTRLSLPLMLIGILLLLRGSPFVREAAFPLGFLFMMIPLPYIIYYRLTFPMQLMSAKLASGLLQAIGVDAIRRGNMILMPNYTLEVVAACSGLRSLMTLATLALVMCTFSKLDTIRRIGLVILSAPIAIFANTARLAVTAIGARIAGPAFAEGTIHEISGLIVFGIGFAFLLFAWGILAWSQKRARRT